MCFLLSLPDQDDNIVLMGRAERGSGDCTQPLEALRGRTAVVSTLPWPVHSRCKPGLGDGAGVFPVRWLRSPRPQWELLQHAGPRLGKVEEMRLLADTSCHPPRFAMVSNL